MDWSLSRADVVLALGTRLNFFSTFAYGSSRWPTGARLIQVDIKETCTGLMKPVPVGIKGDAHRVATRIVTALSSTAGDARRSGRGVLIEHIKAS